MFCPFCNTAYEADSACFCHPAPRAMAAEEKKEPTGPPAHEQPPVGIDNPFWKPEIDPAAFPQYPTAKRIAPGIS